MSKTAQTPVDTDFLKSPEFKALVDIRHQAGQSFYHPKDGQGPFGPIVPLAGTTFDLKGQKTPTILFADPGTDDMVAAILALDASSNLDLKMIIPSFGNVGADQTAKNTLTLLSLTRAFNVKVGLGAAEPLLGPDGTEDASGEHGLDGLGGATPINEDEVRLNKRYIVLLQNGVEIVKNDLIKRFENRDNGAEPLMLTNTGTLTDLALLLSKLDQENPEAISMISGISMMAGGIDRGLKKPDGQYEKWHTNIRPHAEFNVFKDPPAAAAVFELIQKHNIPALLFPLDLTHQTGVREDHEGAWLKQQAAKNANPVADFAAQLYPPGGFDLDRSANIFRIPDPSNYTRCMHDANATGALIKPNLYDGFMANVQVVADGEEAGRTIVTNDPNGHVFVAVQADVEAVLEYWQTTFANFSVQPEQTFEDAYRQYIPQNR